MFYTKIAYLFACIILLGSISKSTTAAANAQTDDTAAYETLKTQVAAAMKRFEKGEIQEAATELPPYSIEMLREYFPANFSRSFKENQPKTIATYGASLSDVSLIREEMSGNSYCRLTGRLR